jgi:hypothetical protein
MYDGAIWVINWVKSARILSETGKLTEGWNLTLHLVTLLVSSVNNKDEL